MAVALLHARKGSALRAAGRVTEADAELPGRRRAAPRGRRRGRAGPGARRAQRRAAALPGVRGRAHGRAARRRRWPARRGRAPSRRGSWPCSGFSLAYLEDADGGRRGPRRGRGGGGGHRRAGGHRRGPRAPRRAARRARSTGSRRASPTRARAWSGCGRWGWPAPPGWRCSPTPPTRCSGWAGGTRPSRRSPRRGTLRPTGAAALDVRLARCRIDLARGRLDDAAADLEAVELLARSTTGPRQRIPLLVLFSALALWRRRPGGGAAARRGRAHRGRGGRGRHLGGRPAGVARHLGVGRPRHRGHAAPSQAQVDRLRHHCAELARRGSSTVPAVRSSIEAFSLMCTAEMGRAEQATDPDAWERAADTFDRLQHPYPARLRPDAAGRGAARPPRAQHRTPRRCCGGPTDLARDLGARPLLDDIAALAGRARDPARRCRRPPPPAHAAPGRARRAHRARAGGAARAGQRPHQPGDRRAALHQREDRGRARRPDLHQDRRAQPGAGQRRAAPAQAATP